MVRARCSSAPAVRPSSAAVCKVTAAEPMSQLPLAVRGRGFRPSEDGGHGSSASPSARQLPNCSTLVQQPDRRSLALPKCNDNRMGPHGTLEGRMGPAAPIQTRAKTVDCPLPAAGRQHHKYDHFQNHRRASLAIAAVLKAATPQRKHRPHSAGPACQQLPRFPTSQLLVYPRPRSPTNPGHVSGLDLKLLSRNPFSRQSQPAAAAAAVHLASQSSQKGLRGHQQQQIQQQQQQIQQQQQQIQQQQQLPFSLAYVQGTSVQATKDPGRSPSNNIINTQYSRAAPGHPGHCGRNTAEVLMEGDEEYWEWLFKEQRSPGSPYGSDVLRALLSCISPKFAVKRPDGYVPATPSDISSTRYVRSDVWNWSGAASPKAVVDENAAPTVIPSDLPLAPSPRFPTQDQYQQQQQQQGVAQEEEQKSGQDFFVPLPESCSPERKLHRKLSRRAAAAVASILRGGEVALANYPQTSHNLIQPSQPPQQPAPQALSPRLLPEALRPQPQPSQPSQQEEGPTRAPMPLSPSSRPPNDAPAASTSLRLQSSTQDTPIAAATGSKDFSSLTLLAKCQHHQEQLPPHTAKELRDELIQSFSQRVTLAQAGHLPYCSPTHHPQQQKQLLSPPHQLDERGEAPKASEEGHLTWKRTSPEAWQDGSAAAEQGRPGWARSCYAGSNSDNDEDHDRNRRMHECVSGVSQSVLRRSSGGQQYNQQGPTGSTEQPVGVKSRFYLLQYQHHHEQQQQDQGAVQAMLGTTAGSESRFGTSAVPEPFQRLASYQRQYTPQSPQALQSRLSRQASREKQLPGLGCADGGAHCRVVEDPVGLHPRTLCEKAPTMCAAVDVVSSSSTCNHDVRNVVPPRLRRVPSMAWQEELAHEHDTSAIEQEMVTVRPMGPPQLPPPRQLQPSLPDSRMTARPPIGVQRPPLIHIPLATGHGYAVEAERGAEVLGLGGNRPPRGTPPIMRHVSAGSAASRVLSPSLAGCARFGTPNRLVAATDCGEGSTPRVDICTPTHTASGALGDRYGGYRCSSPGGFRGPAHCIRARSAGPERPSPVALAQQAKQQQETSTMGSVTPSNIPPSRRLPPPVMPLTWEPPPLPVTPVLLLLPPGLPHSKPVPSQPLSHSDSCISTPSCPSSPYGDDGGLRSSKDDCDLATTAAIEALMSLSPHRSGAIVAAPEDVAPKSSGGPKVPADGMTDIDEEKPDMQGSGRQQYQPPRRQTEALADAGREGKGCRSAAPGESHPSPDTTVAKTACGRAGRSRNYSSILDVTAPPPPLMQRPLSQRAPAMCMGRMPLTSRRDRVLVSLYAPRSHAAQRKVSSPSSVSEVRSPSKRFRASQSTLGLHSPLRRHQAVASPRGGKTRSPRVQHEFLPMSPPSPLRSSSLRRRALGSPSAGAVLAARHWVVTPESCDVAGGRVGADALSEPGEAFIQPPEQQVPTLSSASTKLPASVIAYHRWAPSSGIHSRPSSSHRPKSSTHDSVGGHEVELTSDVKSTCGAGEALVASSTGATAAAASKCGAAAAPRTDAHVAGVPTTSASPFLTPGLAAALGPAAAGLTSGSTGSSSSSDCGVGDSRGAPPSTSTCAVSVTAAVACASSVDSWSSDLVTAASSAAAVPSSVISYASSRTPTEARVRQIAKSGLTVVGATEARFRYNGIPRAARRHDGMAFPTAAVAAAAAEPPLPPAAGTRRLSEAAELDSQLEAEESAGVMAVEITGHTQDRGKYKGVRRNLLCSFERVANEATSYTPPADARGDGELLVCGPWNCSRPPPRSASAGVIREGVKQLSRQPPPPLARPSVDMLTFAPGVFSPLCEAASRQVHMLPPRPKQRQLDLQHTLESSLRDGPEAVTQVEQSISEGASAARRNMEAANRLVTDTVVFAPKPPLAPQSRRSSSGACSSAQVIIAVDADAPVIAPVDAVPYVGVGRRESGGGGSRPISATSLCSVSSNGSSSSHHHHHWSYQRNRERALLINGAITAAAAAVAKAGTVTGTAVLGPSRPVSVVSPI